MSLIHAPSLPTRGPPRREQGIDRTVVRLRGEHDISTVVALSVELARAIALDDADIVVDLRDVQFMDASTVGVIIGAREFLHHRGRSLTIRSLSSFARRLIDVCRLDELVDPDVDDSPMPAWDGAALATWIAVPATQRIARRA